jgi:hypothetical protein
MVYFRYTFEKYSDGALSLNRVQFCVGRLEYMRLELTHKTDLEHQAYLTQKFGGLNNRAKSVYQLMNRGSQG